MTGESLIGFPDVLYSIGNELFKDQYSMYIEIRVQWTMFKKKIVIQ